MSAEPMRPDNSWLAIKRYTAAARRRGKPKRHQRRFRSEDEARTTVSKWQADREVQTVWLFGPADSSGTRPPLDLEAVAPQADAADAEWVELRSGQRVPVCPSCGSRAKRCKRPSGHDAAEWHAARVALLESASPTP